MLKQVEQLLGGAALGDSRELARHAACLAASGQLPSGRALAAAMHRRLRDVQSLSQLLLEEGDVAGAAQAQQALAGGLLDPSSLLKAAGGRGDVALLCGLCRVSACELRTAVRRYLRGGAAAAAAAAGGASGQRQHHHRRLTAPR